MRDRLIPLHPCTPYLRSSILRPRKTGITWIAAIEEIPWRYCRMVHVTDDPTVYVNHVYALCWQRGYVLFRKKTRNRRR